MRKMFLVLSLFVFHLSVSASPGGLKTISVVLDWFVNPNHAPLFVAQQEGFFTREGIKVKFITPTNAAEGEKMVAAKRADLAVTYQPALFLHLKQGLPLKQFATLIDKPLGCFITLQIDSLQNLKGKKIGFSGTEIERIMLDTMLRSVGLDLRDVKMINVNYNLVSGLLSGKLDGFIGGMRNFEPLAIVAEGKKANVFYPEKHGFPEYSELILVAHNDKVNDQFLIKFLRALKEGVEYLKKNPETSWQKFTRNHPELNSDLNKKSWFVTWPYFANDPGEINQNNQRKLEQFIKKVNP